uniref:AAA+ ATPase domain-containing protein n=1 Tax=Tetraodon nigroviridis TaxID=99883 RepID=H3CM14_TETNG
FHSSKFDNITCKELIRSGSPTIYRLKPELEKIGTLKRLTLGKKDPRKANKTILLVGETGTGKSTLINALVNYAIGVKWEDDVWFDIVGDKAANQPQSQTSDVIVYEIFGFEGRTLPFSLTLIDTPGYGDTRRMSRDSIITQRLHDWFRFEDGIHEISAVGLVVKASVSQLSNRLLYVFDSVTSLFGKDVKKNMVALITHSNGRKPKNVLIALESAKIQCARDEQNQIVHFLFNNCQTEDREEDADALKSAESTSMKGLTKFTDFLSKIEPQKLKVTVDVLNERVGLAACIKHLKERITFIELKRKEVEEVKRALAEFEEQMKENANFTVEVVKVSKEKQRINSGMWGLFFYEGATCCTVCEENCHYPGCTTAWSPKDCEVMIDGRCTSCTGKCPVS